MGILSKAVSKGLSKTGKKQSSEVAKKSTEVMGRRPNKDMGMVEEVTPKRLSGPKADEAKDAAKRGSSKAAIAGAAAAGAAGAAVLSSRDNKDSKSPTRVESKGRTFQEDRPVRDAGRVSSKAEETTKAKEASKPSTFGAAFKEARAAGKGVFTYNGKKYTTEMAGEKKAAPKAQSSLRANAAEDDATKRITKTGVREGRNENIDEDTRKRAMGSVANLAKGGSVKAKKK